ncbi:MAG: AsmA-like C-terminal domain-containing protein [Rhodospirillales bacterium]|nr:AsmA-like C-terminal domain-containing protein [Rhodospirillales bacterium]MCB9979602.1 AsmA-like C-terminal domain-containing protein [Rhodospirillales bacterium]
MPDTQPDPTETPVPKRRLHKTRKVAGFSLHVFLELFVVVLLVSVGAAAFFLYKLSRNELDMAFAKQQLEKTINAEIAPYRIETKFLGVEWTNIFDRPVFRVDDLYLLNPQGEKLLTMEEISLTLSRGQIFSGNILPREISVKGLDMHFVRNLDGSVQLGFVAGPSYLLYRDEMDGERISYASLDEIYHKNLAPLLQKGFFKGLRKLDVLHSSIVFEDLKRDLALSFPDINMQLMPTMRYVRLDLINNNGGADYIKLGLRYDTLYNELQATFETRNFDPFHWASFFDIPQLNANASHVTVDSEFQAIFDDRFNMRSAEMTFDALDGTLSLPGLYDDPFSFQNLSFSGFFNPQALTFDLRDGVLSAYNQIIRLEGDIPLPSAGIAQYEIPLTLKVDTFLPPLASAAFPDAFQEKPLYKWLTQRLEKGKIKDLSTDIVLDVTRGEDDAWTADMKSLLGTFAFEDLYVNYKAPMRPLSGITGHATIDSGPDKMSVSAESGHLGDIDLSNISIGIRDVFADRKSTVDLDFNARGAFRDFLDYLKPPPVHLAEKIEFDPDSVEGRAALHVKMTIPTDEGVPLEKIGMDITGTLEDALIPKLVKGLDVAGDHADITIRDGLIRASGTGRLSGRTTTFDFQQYIKSAGKPFKMKVAAQLTSDVNLQRHFGVDVEDYISGSPRIDLDYTSFPDETADIQVRGDLTSAGVHITPLGYMKPPGQAASVSLGAKLKEGDILSVDQLTLTGPDLRIRGAHLDFQNNSLKKAVFPDNRIGESSLGMTLSYTAPRAVTLDLSGEVLDARALLKQDKKAEYDGPALSAKVNVQKLITHGEYSIAPSQAYMEMLQNGDITQFEMDGRTGEGEVYIRYKPGPDGSPSLRAEMSDAGAALKALGLYENVQGGHLTVTGTSADRVWRGNMTGNFLMKNFSVRKAPALAKLISAMSLPGLGRLLGDQGLVFKKLTADFTWNARPGGAMIQVKDGRTSGSELGLTFEGSIDRASNTLNLEGTIVPVSTLNNLIGGIPLLGAVITGGTGSLIAATYKIKGPFEDSKVSINPLSALAPGIIRKILFED